MAEKIEIAHPDSSCDPSTRPDHRYCPEPLQKLKRVGVALLAIAVLALYAQPMGFYLVSEDYSCGKYFDQTACKVDWHTVARAFWAEAPSSAGERQYHPFFGSWYALNYTLFGFRPALWHFSTVLLHLVTTGALGLLAWQILRVRHLPGTLAIWVVAGFLLFPQNTISYSWCAAVTDLMETLAALMALFFCGATILAVSDSHTQKAVLFYSATFACVTLAFMAKETALALGPALLVHSILILWTRGLFNKPKALVSTISALMPLAVLEVGYIIFRKAIFGQAFTMSWRPVSLNAWAAPARICAFLREWYYPVNPLVFQKSAQAVSEIGAALWAIVLACGAVALCCGPRLRARAGVWLHAAVLFLVFAFGSAVPSPTPPEFGVSSDSYIFNGLICLALICIPAGIRQDSDPEPATHFRHRLGILVPRFGTALLIITAFYWTMLSQANLYAIGRSNDLSRRVCQASNHMLDAQPTHMTPRLINRPLTLYGITCTWRCEMLEFFRFPIRQNPWAPNSDLPGFPPSHVMLLDASGKVRIRGCADFLKAARKIVTTQNGTLKLQSSGHRFAYYKTIKPFEPHHQQYLYVSFTTQNSEFFNSTVVYVDWRGEAQERSPLCSNRQTMTVSEPLRDDCWTLITLGENPLYTRGPSPAEFWLSWSEYSYPERSPIDLAIKEVAIMEIPQP